MSTSSSTQQQVSDEQLLSHYVYRKIREANGPVNQEEIAMSVSDVADLNPSRAISLIEAGQTTGNYSVQRNDSGDFEITSVSPIGPAPSVIVERFGEMNVSRPAFISIDEVDTDVEDILSESYASFEELAEADPDELTQQINEGLDSLAESTDFDSTSRLTGSEVTALHDHGITTERALVQADPEELANISSSTLTEAKVSRAQDEVEDNVHVLDVADATAILEASVMNVPVGSHLAATAVTNHTERKDALGTAGARITTVEEVTDSVGEPLAVVNPNIDAGHPDANYVSDTGHNDGMAVNTGFPILEDVGYEKVPKLASDTDAGHSALPVDENGEAIPPTIPLERDLQMPLDELIAKKLARNVPVRVVGPRGSGKNYLLKYIAHKTNRGYRTLDVDKATMPQDLFGPVSPNEDGKLEPRNAEVKQGLLNGDLIVINEFPVMKAGAAMSMHQLLNENKLVIKSHGEEIEPHPQARVIITMNPPTREYRDSEPMNSATRGRFRTFWQGYPDTEAGEVRALDQQLNVGRRMLKTKTLEKVVEFAHRTRKDEMSSWPTLSTRNLTIIGEHIGDGAAPAAAVKNVLRNVAEPHQHPEDAFDAINDLF